MSQSALSTLEKVVPLVRELILRLEEESTACAGMKDGRTILQKRLTERLFNPWKIRVQIAEMPGNAPSDTKISIYQVALELLTCRVPPSLLLLSLAQDYSRLLEHMQRALHLRQRITSCGCLELAHLFSERTQPRERVSLDLLGGAVKAMPELVLWLSEPVKQDLEIARYLVQKNPSVLALFSEELLHREDFIYALIEDGAETGEACQLPYVLAYLPPCWLQHPACAQRCVEIWWALVPHFRQSLLTDRSWIEQILLPNSPEEASLEEDEESSFSGVDQDLRAHLVLLSAESDPEDWPWLRHLMGRRANGWAHLPEALRDRMEVAEFLLESPFDPDWIDEEIMGFSPRLRRDRDLARRFIAKGAPLEAWHESLWSDRELWVQSVLQLPESDCFLPEALAEDRLCALAIVGQRPDLLQEFVPSVRQDPEVFALALSASCSALDWASDRQRACPVLMRAAIRQWGLEAFRYACASLRGAELPTEGQEAEPQSSTEADSLSFALMEEVIQTTGEGLALSLGSDSLRLDPRLRALARDKPEGFQPKEFAILRRESAFTRERWLQLLLLNGTHYHWAPDWIRADRQLTLMVARQALLDCPEDEASPLLHPMDCCAQSLRSDPEVWKELFLSLPSDKHLEPFFGVLMRAPEAVRSSPEVLVLLLSSRPKLWECLPRELRAHPRLLEAMIRLIPREVAAQFPDDEAIIQACCEQEPQCFRRASERLRGPGPFARQWLEKEPDLFRHLSQPARADQTLIGLAIQGCWSHLRHASEAARADPEIVQMAMRQHPCALGYAMRTLRESVPFLMDCLRKGISLRSSLADRFNSDPFPDYRLASLRTSEAAEDPALWSLALRELGPGVFHLAPHSILRHASLMQEAARQDPSLLAIVSPFLRAQSDWMAELIQEVPSAQEWVHPSLSANPQFRAGGSR